MSTRDESHGTWKEEPGATGLRTEIRIYPLTNFATDESPENKKFPALVRRDPIIIRTLTLRDFRWCVHRH